VIVILNYSELILQRGKHGSEVSGINYVEVFSARGPKCPSDISARGPKCTNCADTKALKVSASVS